MKMQKKQSDHKDRENLKGTAYSLHTLQKSIITERCTAHLDTIHFTVGSPAKCWMRKLSPLPCLLNIKTIADLYIAEEERKTP